MLNLYHFYKSIKNDQTIKKLNVGGRIVDFSLQRNVIQPRCLSPSHHARSDRYGQV